MNWVLSGLILSSVHLTSSQRMLLFFPLCLSIALVYKTLRCERLRDVPLATAVLFVTILAGMFLVVGGIAVLYSLMA